MGVYATLDKWSSGEVFKLDTIFDVMFNLGFLLIIIGGIGQVFRTFPTVHIYSITSVVDSAVDPQLVSMRIWIRHMRSMRIQVWIQGFGDKNVKIYI